MSAAKKVGMSSFLEAAKKLHDLGLSLHWIRPNSKAPVEYGWNRSKRNDWSMLKRKYHKGNGVGILLGSASGKGDEALAVIDVDVRSPEPCYRAEAEAIVDRLFPGLRESAPFVWTGRGNGSAHFYILTKGPVENKKLGHSSILVKVFSPSTAASGKQKEFVRTGHLTLDELNEGFRMKAAWEVELLSLGKQVVAPPSIHPDTRVPYRWGRDLA